MVSVFISEGGTSAGQYFMRNQPEYSAVIILINLFLNQKKHRFTIIFIALGALLWTTRFTPIVTLLLSIFSYFIVRNKLIFSDWLNQIVHKYIDITWLHIAPDKHHWATARRRQWSKNRSAVLLYRANTNTKNR